MVGVALGVVVPEELPLGRLVTELALGRLQLGDPGVEEAIEIGVAVFCGSVSGLSSMSPIE